jgi:D-aminopeptidase
MSRGVETDTGGGYTREEAEQSSVGKDFLKTMKYAMDYGIPIVLASGNNGDQDRRKLIDSIPQVLEKETFQSSTSEQQRSKGSLGKKHKDKALRMTPRMVLRLAPSSPCTRLEWTFRFATT